MAKMRMVTTAFWNDSWIRTRLNPLDRYLFIYLLTNDHTNICGTYELPLDVMSFETGLDKEDLKKSMLPRMRPKMWYLNGWVYFPNWEKHHQGTEKTRLGIEYAKKLIPSHIMEKIEEINAKLDAPSMPHDGPSGSSASASSSALASKDIVADATPWSLGKEIKTLEESPHRYKNVIALYLEYRKPDIRDGKQLSAAIQRHCKPAKLLEPFDDDQIIKAFKKAKDLTPEWTIETAYKLLTK